MHDRMVMHKSGSSAAGNVLATHPSKADQLTRRRQPSYNFLTTQPLALRFSSLLSLVKKPARAGFFVFKGLKMRTIAYVDGYNLYYGRLQGTPHKWLDLPCLIRHVLRIQNPAFQLTHVKYFTSPVLGSLATRGNASVEAQNAYLRALEASGVEIIKGRHQLESGKSPRFVAGMKASRADTVDVWHLDEKETDVRMALSMYRDACQKLMDQAVLISSDTDMVPTLELLKSDFQLPTGLILPRHPAGKRPPAGSLQQRCDWTRQYLLDTELAASQFPARVPTRKKPADKPAYW